MFARRLPAVLAGLIALAVTIAERSPHEEALVAAPASVALPGTSQSSSVVSAGPTVSAPAAAPLRFTVAPTGNEARYRVREQLAGVDFPNDAVGSTTAITGGIVVDEKGAIVASESRFVVDLTPLKSDRDRRDNYLQRRTLETATHPTVTLVPTALRGLTLASAPSGERTFELVADLTIKGVTRPTIWNVSARFADGQVTGSAATAFSFEEFGLAKPRVASVLSVADTIRLEYDFTLVGENRD